MFVPAPIESDFVPYTHRPVLRRNAALFVKGRRRGGRSSPRVVPQNSECAGKRNGTECGYYAGMYCCDGECIFGGC
jgi:hypothetical protein